MLSGAVSCMIDDRFCKKSYRTTDMFKLTLCCDYLHRSAFSFIYNCWKQYHHRSQKARISSFVCYCNWYRSWKKFFLLWASVPLPTHMHASCIFSHPINWTFTSTSPSALILPSPSHSIHMLASSAHLCSVPCHQAVLNTLWFRSVLLS